MIWFYDDSIELDDLGHFSWHIWKKKLVPHVFLEVSCCSIIFFLQMLQISKILNKLLYKQGNTEHKAYKLAIKQKHKPTIITFPHSLCERVIFLVVVTKTATYTQFTIRHWVLQRLGHQKQYLLSIPILCRWMLLLVQQEVAWKNKIFRYFCEFQKTLYLAVNNIFIWCMLWVHTSWAAFF